MSRLSRFEIEELGGSMQNNEVALGAPAMPEQGPAPAPKPQRVLPQPPAEPTATQATELVVKRPMDGKLVYGPEVLNFAYQMAIPAPLAYEILILKRQVAASEQQILELKQELAVRPTPLKKVA